MFFLNKRDKNPLVLSSNTTKLTDGSFIQNSIMSSENQFPTIRYENSADMFNNIHQCSSKQYKITDEERIFIDAYINALSSSNLPCSCLLSRMSNGELTVYYKNIEVGRIKLNGSRNYLTVSHDVSKHYEAKSMNFYISKMKRYWISDILRNIAIGYVK